jgi:hypothetical protein
MRWLPNLNLMRCQPRTASIHLDLLHSQLAVLRLAAVGPAHAARSHSEAHIDVFCPNKTKAPTEAGPIWD